MPEIPYRLFQAKERLFKTFRPQEYQRRQAFKALRETAIAQSKEDLRNRLATNPLMTPLEQVMGGHVENLEPQVREAVVRMNELGYSTTCSGFWGDDYHQIIQFDNALNPATKQRLQSMGVTVRENILSPHYAPHERYYETDIEFQSETPDLEAIRRRWNDIVAVISPSGEPLLDKPRWHMLLDEHFARQQGQK